MGISYTTLTSVSPWSDDATACHQCADAEGTICCNNEAWCADCHSRAVERAADALRDMVRELLAALAEVAPWFYGEHDYDHPSCRIIRAAIAKADGVL